MKWKLFVIPLLFFIIQTACSQDTASHLSSAVFFSAGYANESPVYVREYYDNVVEFYRDNGVPIPTQLDFGRTITADAGIYFKAIKGVRIGFSIGYSFSPAYSNYQDYAGTLKVNGSVNALEIAFRGQFTTVEIADVPIYLNIQLGVCQNSASITQELRFIDFPENNFDSKWSASAWGVCSQLTFGVPVRLGDFILVLEGGYRYSSCQVTGVTIESSTGNSSIDSHWDIGQDGFVFLASIEMNI